MAGPESTVKYRWDRAKGSRLGRWLFSRAVGRYAPYTGTIGARIEELEPGRAVVTMRDRKAVRNHLQSIHAAALMNMIELTGSLTVFVSMQPDTRMIPIRIETEFIKKARGTVTAEGRCTSPEPGFEGEIEGNVTIRDTEGDEVARGLVTAKISPRP
jgi:acyl-coenzyme A thioesterase PaaI-like protein